MEDAEKLENEVSQLLNGLEEVERLLTSNRNRAYIEKEVSNLSSQIVTNSKTIDYLLNKTDLFDEPSEEMDEKLRQLEIENRKTQTQFEQVKVYTEKLREVSQQSFDKLLNVKFNEEKNAGFDDNFF